MARRALLTEFCKRSHLSIEGTKAYSTAIRNTVFGRLKWCRIPKTGTTFIQYPLKKALISWKKQRTEGLEDYNNKIEESFVFVREPYSRLVSAYYDKILTNPIYWYGVGRYVMIAAGKLQLRQGWYEHCAAYATFSDFIKYFISSETTGHYKRDPHFIPIHYQCQFCQRNYTYIGHLETFQEDLDYILNTVQVNMTLPPQEKDIITRKAVEALDEGKKQIYKCSNKFDVMNSLWISFQGRGFIPQAMKMSVTKAQSEKMTAEEFGQISVDAFYRHRGTFDSTVQRRNMLIQLYRQISINDRLAVKSILAKDFEMFQYDSQPYDIFPDLPDHSYNDTI